MTKKDYILIADAIKNVWDGEQENPVLLDIISQFCQRLGKDNQNFDRSKFIRYIRGDR